MLGNPIDGIFQRRVISDLLGELKLKTSDIQGSIERFYFFVKENNLNPGLITKYLKEGLERYEKETQKIHDLMNQYTRATKS